MSSILNGIIELRDRMKSANVPEPYYVEMTRDTYEVLRKECGAYLTADEPSDNITVAGCYIKIVEEE